MLQFSLQQFCYSVPYFECHGFCIFLLQYLPISVALNALSTNLLHYLQNYNISLWTTQFYVNGDIPGYQYSANDHLYCPQMTQL